MNKSIRIEKPGSLNGVDFLKDIFKVVKKTDEENWSYFGEEGERDFAVKFLKYGELTRLIYVGNKPVAYISCFLLKPNGHTLLKDDYYKSLGLGLYDLLMSYDGTKRSYRRNSLYINVIAVVEEYQGNVSILKAIAKALYNIIECDLFYTRSSIGYLCPYKIYAVVVTNNGARMCDFFGFNLIGSSTRIVNELETERMLYGVNVDSFIIKLRKIVL